MRILVSLVGVLLLAPSASAQWTCPYHRNTSSSPENQNSVSENADSAPSKKYNLQGVIGSKKVRMYLNQDGSNSDGLFYFLEGDWAPVILFGNWKSDGFEFAGESEIQEPIGHLQGKLTDNVLLGQWTPKGSDQAEPVRVSVVPKMSCAGKGEWKRFDSSKWPFSFSYPASWHLVEESGSDRYIRLICPDPEEMIDRNDVEITEGLGDPSASKETRLVQCGKEWRYEADCGDDISQSAFSHIPVESVRHGLKILDVSGGDEWRAYCRNWGYVGQTEGTDLIVLLQGGWISITKERDASDIVGRIVDTVRPHTDK